MILNELKCYQKVQNVARYTLDSIADFIRPGVSEADLVRHCDELQRNAGIDCYWYKALPALVLVGSHTTLAISNTAYEPNDAPIKENDLVTIDLNPSIQGYCGDYARTYYIEGGVTRRLPQFNEEFITGARAQEQLHAKLLQVANRQMTFNELYQVMHEDIDRLGFEQLDYLGHNVQKDMTQLEFIAPHVMLTLGEAGLFTLEPQIRLKGGLHGFKHENIYYFNGQQLQEL